MQQSINFMKKHIILNVEIFKTKDELMPILSIFDYQDYFKVIFLLNLQLNLILISIAYHLFDNYPIMFFLSPMSNCNHEMRRCQINCIQNIFTQNIGLIQLQKYLFFQLFLSLTSNFQELCSQEFQLKSLIYIQITFTWQIFDNLQVIRKSKINNFNIIQTSIPSHFNLHTLTNTIIFSGFKSR